MRGPLRDNLDFALPLCAACAVLLLALALLWALTENGGGIGHSATHEESGDGVGSSPTPSQTAGPAETSTVGSKAGALTGQEDSATGAPANGERASPREQPSDSTTTRGPSAEANEQQNGQDQKANTAEAEPDTELASNGGEEQPPEVAEDTVSRLSDSLLPGSDSAGVGKDGSLGARGRRGRAAGVKLGATEEPGSDSPGVGKDGSLGARGRRGRAAGVKLGATKESEAAVDAGLAWLAHQQQLNGCWDDNGLGSGFNVGVTGLALLAFLGAGHTHLNDGPYEATVERGLDWLLQQQQQNTGAFASKKFYEQGIATWVLCEAHTMTHDMRFRAHAQRAVDFIVNQMGPNGGYGYSGPGDDVHVTSFQIMAVKSAIVAELTVPADAIAKLKDYLNQSIAPDGTTGYKSTDRHGTVRGARTSAGLLCRLFLGYGREHQDVQKTTALIDRAGPMVADIFYTYNSTYCMFQMGGTYWQRWNPPFRDGVIAIQQTAGPAKGSWNASVLQTTLYVMSLEVYYRYLPVYK